MNAGQLINTKALEEALQKFADERDWNVSVPKSPC